MTLHLRFVTWNPLTSAYVPLPDGTRVRAVAPGTIMDGVLDEARIDAGIATLRVPEDRESRFEASLGGDAIDWEHGLAVPPQTPASWTPPDPWIAHLGARRLRERSATKENPVTIRLGREAFVQFVRWDEESGGFRSAAANLRVTAWDADFLGATALGSAETDADGRAWLRLDESGEREPDVYFTVERAADAPDDGLPPAANQRWSSRDQTGEHRPDRVGYWANFTGQRIGRPDDPWVFALDRGSPRLHAGNKATLLVDGPALLAAWEAAIDSARFSLHLEVMLYFDDPMTRRVQAKILEKARQGIKVRLLLGLQVTTTNKDFIQTEMLWARMFRRFTPEQRGAALAALTRKYEEEVLRSDLTALLAELRAEPNVTVLDTSFSRLEVLPGLHVQLPPAYGKLEDHLPFFAIARVDHRKLLVVDGRVAVLGGQNVGQEYVYDTPYDPMVPDGSEAWCKWHDVSVTLEGPVVRDLQRLFRERWVTEGGDAFATGSKLENPPEHPTFPPLAPALGGMSVRIVDTTPGARRHYYATTLGLFRAARREILVMNPYFSSPEALDALLEAARRGVHVVFVLPDQRNDSIDFLYAARLWYGEMIEAGIQVFEYQNHMCHAKVAVVDDVAVIGTANLNHSSFYHHYELAAVIEDAGFARDMKAALWERDLRCSRRIRPEDLPELLDINGVAELYLRNIVHKRF